MPGSVQRRLTTIFAADVAGYSRLMENDEVATLETLKRHRDAMTGLIERHQGRVVNTSGDGLLAEFPSVVEAVQCAAEVQRELAARNAQIPGERRLVFRIGINLGDVMVEGDDIYGEGVNIAARIEGLAEPGGVCIAGTVYDQVRNKLSLHYQFLGDQSVKNISEQVPVYRVDLDAATGASPARARAVDQPAAAPVEGTNEERSWRIRRFYLDAAGCGVILLVLFFVDALSSPERWWVHWAALAMFAYLVRKAIRAFGEAKPNSTGAG